MAITQTARYGMTRWGADGDVQDRADFVKIIDALETAAKVAQAGMRNRLHNGDFRVNQRGYASATALAAGVYGFDRWRAATAATTLTYVAATQGQAVTVNAGGSVAQVIERANMPAGRYVLSHAGTAQARVYNGGAAAPAYAAAPFVVDLDGLTDVVVELQGHGGATRTIDRVQLEQIGAAGVAADATPFERRPLGAELTLCQRYYQKHGADTVIATPLATGLCVSTSTARFTLPLPVEMRAAPSVVVNGNSYQVRYGADLIAGVSSLALHGNTGRKAVGLTAAMATAILTVGQSALLENGGSTVGIDVSAEL